MQTIIVRSRDELSAAADVIRAGGLCLVPTETVYGIAADATNPDAVQRLYDVKGRPPVKPISLLIPNLDAAKAYADVPDALNAYADAFWPGPLTMVLENRGVIPPIVTAGGATLGVRCPDHELTLALLEICALPLAVPSANPSGAEPPTTFDAAMAYFDGLVECAIDGGDCTDGASSTVVDFTAAPPKILRRGALTKRELAGVHGDKFAGKTVIGITGGSGAGKTTALGVLGEMGALIYDCDAAYHELLSDAEMLSELNVRFPGVISGGTLDRAALGAIVFADADALHDLSRITHKYVTLEGQRRITAFGGDIIAIDAIDLLSPTFSLGAWCDHTVAVTASPELRAARIMARDNIDETRALARINAQKSDDYYRTNCDAVFTNDATVEEFADTCRDYFTDLLKTL